jgi:hypothetical protein
MKGMLKESKLKISFMIPITFAYLVLFLFLYKIETAIGVLGIYLLFALVSSFVLAIKARAVFYFPIIFILQPLIISSYALGQFFYLLKAFWTPKDRTNCES